MRNQRAGQFLSEEQARRQEGAGVVEVATELAKLVSLRDQGILSEEEFQNARRRLVGTA